jgi:hypothetical protein
MRPLKKAFQSRVVTIVAIVIALACAAPAVANASYTTASEPLYANANPYSWNGMATLPYWSVAMYCWADTSYRVAGSNRWFKVYGSGWTGSNVGYVAGWLPANWVRAQTAVRHC